VTQSRVIQTRVSRNCVSWIVLCSTATAISIVPSTANQLRLPGQPVSFRRASRYCCCEKCETAGLKSHVLMFGFGHDSVSMSCLMTRMTTVLTTAHCFSVP